MDNIKIKCTCGAAIDVNAGDTVFNDIYRWSLSYHCDKCGSATEVDGVGIEDLPSDVKQIIIKKFGEWVLFSPNRVKIKYVLSKLSLANNIEICDSGSEIIVKGTENELRWIAIQLKEKKITDFQIVRLVKS